MDSTTTQTMTKDEVNAARRADYAANIDKRRAAAKAWRRKRKGLPPLGVLPTLTFQQEFAALLKRFHSETGLLAVFKIEVVQVGA